MFTGLIEEVGILERIQKKQVSALLRIRATSILNGLQVGDSIAVNGICLTVTWFDRTSFTADVMHETMNRSSLSLLPEGSRVNLERALAANGRFGGHLVSGHVDGTGIVQSIRRDENAIWYCIRTEKRLLRFLVEKGSVAIDGISLTVAALHPDAFSVSVIPHTARVTALSDRRIGDRVNLETDLIGKYVARLLSLPAEPPDLPSDRFQDPRVTPGGASPPQRRKGITMELLNQHGFC